GLDFDEKRRYPIAFGHYNTLNIPLIIPNHFPPSYYENPDLSINLKLSPEQSYAKLVDEIIGGDQGRPNPDFYFGLWDHRIPDSLLIRLMVYANSLSAAYIVDHNQHGDAPIREPLAINTVNLSALQQLTSGYDPNVAQSSNVGILRERQLESLSNL